MKPNINSPFSRPLDRPEFPGIEPGVDYYLDRQVYLEFIQTGLDENGKALGSIGPVVHETKTSIREVINSNADKVGLKNILIRYSRTGDESLFSARQPLPNGDYSEIPNKTPEEIYATLPKELTNGMTLDQFLKAFNSEMFVKFLESIRDGSKEEDKEGGSNE